MREHTFTLKWLVSFKELFINFLMFQVFFDSTKTFPSRLPQHQTTDNLILRRKDFRHIINMSSSF